MAQRDPVTGDQMAAGEVFAWKVQWIIRRWTFIVALTLITALAWTYVAVGVGWGLRAGPVAVLTWWNLGFSYLAVLIESVVGMSNYHQARRDALILRYLRDQVDRQSHTLLMLQRLGETILEQAERLED